MKIRIGFVSNSSSTSFVVIGKRVVFKDVTLDDFKGKKYFIETGYCYEGGSVNIHTKNFDKNEKERLYKFLQDDSLEHKIENLSIVEVFQMSSDGGEIVIKAGSLPHEDLIMIYGEEEQSSPYNMTDIDELIGYGEWYANETKDNKLF